MKKAPPFRPLTENQAKNSLAAKFGRLADRVRNIGTRLGLRPYRVFLTWTKWTGPERGDGQESVVCRLEILPTPVVSDLSALRLNPFSGGRYPVGSVQVTEVSTSFPLEYLTGEVVPDRPEDQVPEPYEFFYEVVEDGRSGAAPERKRFNLASSPNLDAEGMQWTFNLERTSGDMDSKTGNPVHELPDPPADPWRTRKLTPPDDDF